MNNLDTILEELVRAENKMLSADTQHLYRLLFALAHETKRLESELARLRNLIALGVGGDS